MCKYRTEQNKVKANLILVSDKERDLEMLAKLENIKNLP